MKKTFLSIGLLAFGVCGVNSAYTQVIVEPVEEITPPNDPYYPLQWSHNNTGLVPNFPGTGFCGLLGFDMNIPEAWEYLNKRKSLHQVRVGVLDSGLAPWHPDLNSARILPGKNFAATPYNLNTTDTYGHGTHVVGAIAATVDNGIGIAGVDKNCLVMPVKIDPTVPGSQRVHIADAIRHAVNNNVKVINMSFGWNERTINNEIREAISYGIANGCIFVGASGNFNTNEVHFPAKVGVAVGATNPCGGVKTSVTSLSCEQDTRTIWDGSNYIVWSSNYGAGLDVMAPGTMLPAIDIPGTPGLSGYTNCSAGTCYNPGTNGDYVTDAFGTSIAAPYVTGVVAQVLSVNNQLRMHEVEHLLIKASTTIMDGVYHMLDAYEAVVIAADYTPGSHELADLSVDQVVYERMNPTTVRGTVTVSNKSTTVVSDPTQLQVYLSVTREYNSYYDDDSFTPVQINIPAIAPGATNTYIVTLPYVDYNPADYKLYLNAIVDPGMVQYELDDANNGRSTFVNTNNKPDLIPTQVTYSVNVTSLGKAVNMSYKVKNIGATNGILYLYRDAVRYWDSYDATLSSDDVLLGEENMNGIVTLTPGQEMSFPNKNKLASRSYLLIQVDAEYLNDELNEANNVYAIPLVQTSGTSEEEEKQTGSAVKLSMELFPNPATEQVIVAVETSGVCKITLTDLSGHTLQDMELTESGRQKRMLDTSQLSPGIYFVELKQESGTSILKKLVIQ